MKIIKYINITMIVILILITTLFIASHALESSILYVQIMYGAFSIYYFSLCIIKKEKIEISKIDIIVCILVFSSMIPLIAKNYVSLNDTISTILNYFCILSLFISTKNECTKNPNYKKIIINTIIISIVFLCIIGIDEVNGNYLESFKEVINYQQEILDEQRIGSLFSYPNTMAATCGLGIFLCISCIWESKKASSKIIYTIIVFIMFITMLFTYSRLIYVLFSITFFIFILILAKKYNLKSKVKKKHIIILVSVICVIAIYIIIGLNISDKLKVDTKYQKIMYQAEPEKIYNFLFEIEAVTNQDTENAFNIVLTEKDEYFDDIKTQKYTFGNFVGNKEITLETQKNTAVIYINIEKEEKDATLIINKALLNEKEFILKYKLLPTKVIQKIQSISFSNKSTWERSTFIKDGLKLKESYLFGLGGGAWKKVQTKVQSYSYYTNQMHSYPMKILIENGIIGFLACIGIYAYLFKHFVQETRKKEINIETVSIIIAVLFIMVHSILDFDMSFFYISLVVNLLLALLSIKNSKIVSKSNNALYFFFILFSVFNIYTTGIQIYYKKYIDALSINLVGKEQGTIRKYYKLQPYSRKTKEIYYTSLKCDLQGNKKELQEVLKNMIITEKYEFDNISLQNVYEYIKVSFEIGDVTEEKLNFMLEYIKDTKLLRKYNPDFQVTRFINLCKIMYLLENNNTVDWARTLQEQLSLEIEEKESYILDYQKARYNQTKVQIYREQLENIKNYKKI